MVEGIASPTQRLPALALVLNINSSVRKSLIFPKFRSKTPSRSLHFAFSGRPWPSLSPKASESLVEPATDVKFQTTVKLPGCSDSLALFGTGFREKYFAIIGVKVYAVGLYMNPNIQEYVSAWKDKSAEQIQNDVSLFTSLFQAPSEKSLQIVLVRDVDGKTFWDALDDAISPRITTPTSIDEAAVSTFGNTFQGRPLKKGTLIFLTWAQPSKMLISISENGLPSNVDASIESMNVTYALFDVFFGDGPVSPTLKASVASGLAAIL